MLFVCLFSFYIVTVYRLDHTYSSGSVEPTIALSKSLWSRIVTKKIKKIRKPKISKKYLLLLCVCLYSVLCLLYCLCDFQHR